MAGQRSPAILQRDGVGASVADAVPGAAFDFGAIETDIPQHPIVEHGQFTHRDAITRPGPKRSNKRCNPHDGLFLRSMIDDAAGMAVLNLGSAANAKGSRPNEGRLTESAKLDRRKT